MIREPMSRIVPETPFSQRPLDKVRGILQILDERREAALAPGKGLGLNTIRNQTSKAKLTDFRARHPEEQAIPTVGVTKGPKGVSSVDIPNPDSPDGTWDPYRYAPNFHYDGREDSFPVAPGFDRDSDWDNDPHHYAHGALGGEQGATMNFSVVRKGEYYVLQYASYYVDNKVGCDYHVGDSSMVAVYLKPGKDGKLAPAYMFTSWHNGALMVPWNELKLEPNGRPAVMVGKGSHSVVPTSHCVKPKADGGLVVYGDGRTAKRGSSRFLPNHLTFNSVQGNVRHAERLDAGTEAGQFALKGYYGRSNDLVNPYHPSLFYPKRR